MKSEQIDLFVEERGADVCVRIGGTFGFTQLASFREKILGLLEGPGNTWFLDIGRARFTVPDYVPMFLDFLEKVRQKNASLILIFGDAENEKYFNQYAHIFTIAKDGRDYRKTKILKTLKTLGLTYSRRTGIRMSLFVAIFLSVILLGWFVTLFGIVRAQGEDIRIREAHLAEMEQESKQMQADLEYLQSMVGPLKNLGLIVDSTTSKKSEARIRSWTRHLDRLEDRRGEK